MPDEPEALGLLALMLLTDAAAGPPGRRRGLVLLDDQDRRSLVTLPRSRRAARSSTGRLRMGRRRARTSSRRRSPRSTTRLQTPPRPTGHRSSGCTRCSSGSRRRRSSTSTAPWPLAEAAGPAAGLAAIDALGADPAMAEYRYFHAARADLLRRLERWGEAADAYGAALALTANEPERAFLAGRRAEVASRGSAG